MPSLLDAEFGKMFEGKGEMLIRRWESSVIPKLKRIAALEKGSVTTLLDQNPNCNDDEKCYTMLQVLTHLLLPTAGRGAVSNLLFHICWTLYRYKVKMRKDANGHTSQIPNSISLGPYNGRIIYSGQSISCFICHSTDHQVKQCPSVKCWKCGNLGHKAKVCNFESQCSLCGEKGHIFFSCPSSYVNKARAQQQSGPPVNQRSGPPSAAKPLLLAEPQQPGPLPAAKERPDPPPSVKQQPATEQHQPGILPAKQRCDPPPSVKQQPATEQHQPGILPAKQRSDPPPSANQQSSTDQQQPGTLPAKHRSDLLTVTKQQSSCSPALCQSSYRCLEPSPAPRVYLMFSFSPYRGIVVRPSKRRFLSRSRSLQLRPLRMPSVHQVRRLQVYVVRMHIENSLI
ncbi:uncharacterized protein LOC123966795 isoform X4 [Micropterus dolomieu]|nr:uncharacterized protein LOC123966795 isoform X4 [Micropterus dolomieu]